MRLRLAIAALAVVLAGCATPETTPSLRLTTLMPDTERNFRLSWEASGEGPKRVLHGVIQNTYGDGATNVQLLVQALDAKGDLVSQRIEWFSGVVPGFGSVQFVIARVPPAEQYRVTVWAYERLQGRGGLL
jgi:hypothetical protein